MTGFDRMRGVMNNIPYIYFILCLLGFGLICIFAPTSDGDGI